MKVKTLSQIKDEIESIKSQLNEIDDMRPGSLTKQYRNPQAQSGPFFQISYTHKMKSKTEYVRPVFVKDIQKQIANYKRFKKLIEKWVELAIVQSQVSMREKIKHSELPKEKKRKRKRGGRHG